MTKTTQLPDGFQEVFDKTGAEDIALFPQHGEDKLAALIIIASADSKRQLGAMAEGILRLERKNKPYYEGEDTGWVIVDTGSTIVHLMDKENRQLYDLDSLLAL